jgi:hypothetical protein
MIELLQQIGEFLIIPGALLGFWIAVAIVCMCIGG